MENKNLIERAHFKPKSILIIFFCQWKIYSPYVELHGVNKCHIFCMSS